MNKSFITAVIPVRKGSKRLPNKNILPFADSNLLVHKIRQLKKVKQIDKIIVSTDSKEMIDMAIEEGVEYQVRPDEYCDEKSKTFNEVVKYISQSITTDVLIWAPCVCPLVNAETFSQAIECFLTKEKQYDSVVSSMLLKEYIFDKNGPINFTKEHHVPSQKLPDWHIITNGFFIASANDMEKWGFVYGQNPKLIELSKYEAIDIDDIFDYQLAQAAYQILGEKSCQKLIY